MSDPEGLDYEPGIQRVLHTKQSVKAYYDKLASVYDLLSERAEAPMRAAGLERLDVHPGERVLEIGCGTGHCLVEVARRVGASGRVTGLDLSEKMLAAARRHVEDAGLLDRVELHCGDAAEMPFEDGSFDAVFLSFTLELFDTPEIPVVLGHCRRVLVAGGRIAVVAVSREGKHGAMLHLFEWTHEHFPNLLDCRPIYVRRALEANGFEILATNVEKMWVPVEIVLGRRSAS